MRGFPLIFILLHLTATAKDTPLEKWHSGALDLIGDQGEGLKEYAFLLDGGAVCGHGARRDATHVGVMAA